MKLITVHIVEVREGALVVLLILILWLLIKVFGKTRRMSPSELLRSGQQAEAVILCVQETGLFINNLPKLKVQMQVKPERGRNFVVEVQQTLPDFDAGSLLAGTRVLVKYNPSNHKQVVLLYPV
ncbi:hypothetical protein DYBT9275_04274 [Dyadobacter sp. CECT 9275]|uniref:DUF3592 domain-containing protein n=1 Tax=Dyadobacter helix TaxID=2822344 RepID=A0A916N661_9BACT|nr:hypothetical protein [Dyadobacter sp. CECT 9275]CAG5008461.1 hypothetical protein DYBT9275_04274 [Dyadobacter sp. CECT 9275]